MKKFFVILAVVIAFCISSFAQKKAVADPCLSKDPKIRATSKKPCPSAPSPKKNKPENPPKETDDGDSPDDSDEESTDSPSAEKPTKKPNLPTKNKSPKTSESSGAMFFITIEHNGEKTELAYTQFENHDGNAMLENEKSSRMTFFYGAGNDRANDESFMFNGMIPAAAKGTYQFGTNGVMFSFMATKFPNVPVFLCESGSYDISAMPLSGGFVEGTFSAQCVGEVHDDGSSEKYSMSGKFKLMRPF